MSDNQVIPEAAVEAAARSICDALSMTKWEDQGPLTRDVYRSHARAAFAAAAPHMSPDVPTVAARKAAKLEAWSMAAEA